MSNIHHIEVYNKTDLAFTMRVFEKDSVRSTLHKYAENIPTTHAIVTPPNGKSYTIIL